MPNNLTSPVNDSDNAMLDHHPSDADFYNEEMELPAVRKRAASRTPKKRPSSSSGRSSKKTTAKSIQRVPAGPWRYEIWGLVIAAFCGILLFNALRPSAEGLLPRFGVGALRYLFGSGTSPVLALGLIAGVSLMLRRHRFHASRYSKICLTALLISLTAIHLYIPKGQEFVSTALLTGGGLTGASVAWVLRRILGEWGAFAAIAVASVIAVFQLLQLSFAEAATKLGSGMRQGAQRLPRQNLEAVKSTFTAPFRRESIDEDEFTPWDTDKSTFTARKSKTPNSPFVPQTPPEERTPFLPIHELLGKDAEEIPAVAITAPAEKEAPLEPVAAPAVPEPVAAAPEHLTSEPEEEALTPQEALAAQADASAKKEPVSHKQPQPLRLRKRVGDGPPLPCYFDNAVNALDPPITTKITDSQEDIAKGVQQVEETLAAFRIDAHVTDVKKGPVITRYEVQPAAGVRVASIANLDRDLARALSAIAVRIEAPVPGRNVVGIEVPNKKVQLVRLRDVLDLPEFLSAPSKLSFVLGKDIAGQAKWADLAKMPHMLIAGATNSGKSVCLNSIIASIITRAEPDEVKFSLIDPKRVELTLYRDIPHLYHPVVVEPKEAVRALRGSIAEMERRYKLFAERGVRNIASYNKKLREDDERLPYIVIVIDELADLMMTAAAEFEKLICRLAQLARATGIHLIVATQRPSVNVITGVIKANIPARIAFAVASQVDSRTILDSVGAERLIGSGDMLFDANNGGKSTRIQGAFLSEEEVNRVVEEVKNYYADSDETYEYGLDLTSIDDGPEESSSSSSSSDDKRDSLYDEIKEFVLRYDDMSASLIQRKFEIDYPRAGRIVDQLERDGILGPADGPKPRKVLGGGSSE